MLLRDSGQYWPSVCHYMTAAATAIHYYHPLKKLFIGLDNGTIVEFQVSDDFNRMDSIRDYHAHRGRVTGVVLTSNDWILSAARDNYFQFHRYVSRQCRSECGNYGNLFSSFFGKNFVKATLLLTM